MVLLTLSPLQETFEKASNQKLQVVSIKDNALPVKASRNGNEVNVYRPKVNADGRTTAKPAKVVPIESMKRMGAVKTTEPIKGIEKRPTPSQKTNTGVKPPVNKQSQMQNRKVAENIFISFIF